MPVISGIYRGQFRYSDIISIKKAADRFITASRFYIKVFNFKGFSSVLADFKPVFDPLSFSYVRLRRLIIFGTKGEIKRFKMRIYAVKWASPIPFIQAKKDKKSLSLGTKLVLGWLGLKSCFKTGHFSAVLA